MILLTLLILLEYFMGIVFVLCHIVRLFLGINRKYFSLGK